MPPLTVDPSALDGAGSALIDIGKGIGLTMSTLSGTLAGCGSMCGNDPVGAAIGQRYDASAAAVLQAMAAARNGLVNLGDGVRVSAHNYSRADAQSDVSGRTQPLPVPASSGKITSSVPPSSVGAGDAAPAGFGWVAKYIGMIWPNGDSARLRAAAAAWTAAGTQILVTETAAAGSLGIVGAQQIPEGESMGRAFQASISGAVAVMNQCTSMAAQLTAYAAKIDAVHAAIIDLLSRICDPMTGFKEVWDVLTGEDEDEIKQIAYDIKTVVDNFEAETSALATEMSAAMAAAENVASAMAAYADKEWNQFLHGTDVGRYVDLQLRFDKGVLGQAGGLLQDNWKYGPLRAMTQHDRWFEDWKNTVKGMAPLVGLGGDGAPGVGESWKQVGKELSHWDLWSKDPAEAAGRTAFDIGTLFAPGGAAGGAGKAAHGAAETAEVVGRAAPRAADAAGRATDDLAKGAAATAPRPGSVHPPEAPAGGAPRPLPDGAGKPVGAAEPSSPPGAPKPAPLHGDSASAASHHGPTGRIPNDHAPLDAGTSSTKPSGFSEPGVSSNGSGYERPGHDAGQAHNPPHTGLFDPPSNHGVPGDRLPDLADLNAEYRLPNGAVDPARFSEWAERVAGRYPQISPDGVAGVYDYSTQLYQGMNPYLRELDPLDDGQRAVLGARSIADMSPDQRVLWEERITHTDEGLAALPPFRTDPAEVVSTTWRGMRASDSLLDAMQVGDIFHDPAYLSTSTDPFVAEAFARGALAGQTPTVLTVEGTSGVDISQLSKYVDESEVLFPRGANFEIVARELGPDGIMRIVLRQRE